MIHDHSNAREAAKQKVSFRHGQCQDQVAIKFGESEKTATAIERGSRHDEKDVPLTECHLQWFLTQPHAPNPNFT